MKFSHKLISIVRLPTLGGLKKAQDFLVSNGFAVKAKTGVYDNDKLGDFHIDTFRCMTPIPFERAIHDFGLTAEIENARLEFEDGRQLAQFIGLTSLDDMMMAVILIERGVRCLLELNETNMEFGRLAEDPSFLPRFLNTCVYGKPNLSLRDKIMLKYFPKHWAKKVFGE